MPDAPDSTDATPDANRPDTPPPENGSREAHAGGFTINLASGKAPGSRPRRNKKSAAPPAVVQKTINLSTPKPERDKTAPKASASPKGGKGKRPRGGPKGGRDHGGKGTSGKPQGPTRPSSGTSLADMLDPEVLAKLRGG